MLPPELWFYILYFLTDPDDVFHFCSVSQTHYYSLHNKHGLYRKLPCIQRLHNMVRNNSINVCYNTTNTVKCSNPRLYILDETLDVKRLEKCKRCKKPTSNSINSLTKYLISQKCRETGEISILIRLNYLVSGRKNQEEKQQLRIKCQNKMKTVKNSQLSLQEWRKLHLLLNDIDKLKKTLRD